MKISLITHTGSDIPLSEAESSGVLMVYDIVVLDGVSYRNMLEITADEFYRGMVTAKERPTSSHPSVGDFYSAFRAAAVGADEVLFLSLTSKMSGCYETACAAKKLLSDEGFPTPIFVYDTLQCSQGMALMVREAVRLAGEGCSAEEAMRALDVFRTKVGVYFLLDTLKYAKAGGRVGAIKALAADALGVKPLLCFDKGLVSDIGIARNFQDGVQKLIEKYRKEADFEAEVTVFHQAAPEKAGILAGLLCEKNPGVKYRIDDIGPVIGIYTGPGGAGLAFVKK